MKSYPFSRRADGFSMIELMVVVGIMVILAGLLIGSLPGIQSRINRGKVETFIAELESGLSKYQIDNGSYPLNEPTGDGHTERDRAGVLGASVLYKSLSGDRDLNGQVDFDKNETIYVPRIDYFTNREAREPRSMSIGGQYIVIDSYSNPIRYLAQVPNLGPNETRKTFNPTYDIWSITDANPANTDESAKYITNWQGQ
jgi:prepilin-type N-terminal cleavage/methylation domain-containing protein